MLKQKAKQEKEETEEKIPEVKDFYKYPNYGGFNIKIQFEITGDFNEIKQTIQDFYDKLEQNHEKLMVIYEYMKRIY